MTDTTTNHDTTTDRAETLFEVEAALRSAAISYTNNQTSERRKALREAAVAYADFAIYIEGLVDGVVK